MKSTTLLSDQSHYLRLSSLFIARTLPTAPRLNISQRIRDKLKSVTQDAKLSTEFCALRSHFEHLRKHTLLLYLDNDYEHFKI